MWHIMFLNVKAYLKKVKAYYKKNKNKILIFSIVTVAVILIVIWLLKNVSNLTNDDWGAIGAIGQVVGALATSAAVIVAIMPKKPKIEIDFKMLDKNDNDEYVARIYIFNVSESIAIIHALRISLDKVPDGDLVFESFNSLKDGFRDYREPISILPYQREIIEINSSAMIWGLGHTIDVPNENTKNKYIKITIIVNEKKFVFPTEYTYEHYYNTFTHNF